MTREEAIIEAGIEYSIQNSPYCIGGDNFYEKARELNRNKSFEAGVIWADKNPKSPWISVKDDLPCNHEELMSKYPFGYKKKTVNVLTFLPNGNVVKDSMGYREKWWNGRQWDGEKWEWESLRRPTHWFPIPEPPKE